MHSFWFGNKKHLVSNSVKHFADRRIVTETNRLTVLAGRKIKQYYKAQNNAETFLINFRIFGQV